MKLHRMEYYGYHGVFEEERKLGQRYYIDLELELDLRGLVFRMIWTKP